MNNTIESCSYSNSQYDIPGHLFLINGWEERNPTPNNSILTLAIPRNEYGGEYDHNR